MLETTIKNFFNLPGVIGLGIILIQEKPKSYLCLKEQILLGEVKECLSHNAIRNILKNPEIFDSYEFFTHAQHVYTYKLSWQVALIVITPVRLAVIETIANQQLKKVLKIDAEQTVEIFQKLAKEFPLTHAIAPPSQTDFQIRDGSDSMSLKSQEQTPILEILNALNHLSNFTSTYVGKKVTIKYWDLTRPEQIDCLAYYQMNENAEFVFTGNDTDIVNQIQHYWLKKWTSTFIKKTALILPNLPETIEQKCLNDREKFLILPSQVEKAESETPTPAIV